MDKTVRNTVLNALIDSLQKKDYLTMPMSTLFLFNRPQDDGFAHGEPVTVARVFTDLLTKMRFEAISSRQDSPRSRM